MKWFTRAIVAAVCAGAAAVAHAADAPDESGGGWRMTRLDLTVRLFPDESRATFEARARLRLEIDSSFGPTFGINGGTKTMRFTALTGPESATARLDETLAVEGVGPGTVGASLRLASPARLGEEIDVVLSYESEGSAFQYAVSPDAACASWTTFWCPAALPKPGVRPTPALLECPGTTRFIMPLGWSAVSNGRLVSRRESPDGAQDLWELTTPVARSFAAAPYTRAAHAVNGREIAVYRLGSDPDGAQQQVSTLAAALAAQEARLGPYPYPTYAIAEIPDPLVRWYASSEQGFIMARAEAFRVEHGNLPLWAHEMAHGWWGNLVRTRDPGKIWLSESLAQYFAVVAIEAIEGEAAAAEFLDFSRSGYNDLQCARGYFQMAARGEDIALSQARGDNKWEHNLSDAKGHWVYHMLRHRIGDEAFFSTLRAVLRDFAGRELTMPEMRRAFIAAAPSAGLEEFFAQWLDRTGAPRIVATWEDRPRGAALITLTQTQEGDAYSLPLEIEVRSRDGSRRLEVADLRDRTHSFEVPAPGGVESITLDPRRRALIWRDEYAPGE